MNPLSAMMKVGGILTNPIVRIGHGIGHGINYGIREIFTITEEQQQDHDDYDEAAPEEDHRLSLEGTLWCRKGGTSTWKRRLVVLKFEHEGSFECYKMTQEGPKQIIKDVYSQLHRKSMVGSSIRQTESQILQLVLGRDTPWVAKDLTYDHSTFVIEIPTDDPQVIRDLVLNGQHRDFLDAMQTGSFDNGDDDMHMHIDPPMHTQDDPSTDHSVDLPPDASDQAIMTLASRAKLENDFKSAKKKHVPLRLYFKCPRRGNEKALWLRGFAKVDRLGDAWDKRKFFGKLAKIGMATSRIRRDVFAEFTRDARQLEMGILSPTYRAPKKRAMQRIEQHRERREFLVHPTYCYPHVWMTQSELLEECNLPSTKIHDLRIDSMKDKEIGTLRVEVLQCIGLPKLDRNGHSDGVCYLVCGSYAFATDVIPNNAHPMWPRKSRRGCIFPVFHGYARLFVGVFDDDPGPRDDMAGRAVIDLSRLRPSSRYDVTIPLRMSAHVYSRRRHGAIRLRFQLDWKSERAALMSYLPTTLKIPKKTQPDTRTTVMCTDPSSFRNIALTVHGSHLPGKFSYKHFRGTMKEITFSRKMITVMVQTTLRETMTWVRPAISLFVFCAWMHCIWENCFGLVPAYCMSFLLLHLLRNYVLYGIDGPSSRGFVPPSWEEMFLAIATDKKACIEPLTMSHRNEQGTFQNLLLVDDESIAPIAYDIDTHKPAGKSLFRFLGFLESDKVLETMPPDERHLEFPFSNGKVYPKLGVREAMAKKPRKENEEPVPSGSVQHKSNRKGSPRKQRKPTVRGDDYSMDSTDFCEEDIMMDDMETSQSNDTVDLGDHVGAVGAPARDGEPSRILIPDQDIDHVYDSGGKKVTEDLEDMRENLHRLTWHLFNYKTHVIKHPDAAYFGHDKKATKRKDLKRDMDKLLSLGSYSSSNMIIARAGPYVAPLTGAALSFLSVFRGMFNVFTWRDPFLSFWVSLFGVLVTIVLFFFPWRLFLFLAGCALVGPQVSRSASTSKFPRCTLTTHEVLL